MAPPLDFPISKSVVPHIEFLAVNSGTVGAPVAGGTRIRVINTAGNIEWECDINADTWAALVLAMGTPGTEYIPGNINSIDKIPEGSAIAGSPLGNLNSGGQLAPENWPGVPASVP